MSPAKPRSARRESWRFSRAFSRSIRGLATRSTPHGRSLEAVSAGNLCATPGGRRKKAARGADTAAARDAARAAMYAASTAYLHPLADAHQVKHILGAAAHAARAAELIAGDDRNVGAEHIEHARRRATLTVVDVLKRNPEAPRGGGRVGELLRDLDQALRSRF